MAKNEESAMMRQYNDMKKQKPDSLLLFRCGDFYETYQEDAKECAKILGITLTKREGGYDMAGFPHHALDAYLPKLIRAGKRVAICDLLPDPPKKPAKRGITELVNANENANQNQNENQNKEDKTMKPNENESGNVQNNAQVNNNMAIRTEADVAEVDDIMPKVTPSAKAKPAANTGRTKIVVARVPKPGESADKPKVKPETKPTGVLPVLTLSVYTTRRGEQAPRIDGFGGEEDPRWKRHYDEKMRLSKEKEQAKKKNEKIRQQMKGKSAEEKEALLKKIIHVGSDPFGASYFTDRTNGEKSYYFCMGAKYMDVAQQLVDAYNSGDEQAIAQAEQAVIDCKSGIVAEIEASRNADGDKVETLPETKTEGKTYSEAYIADLLTRATKQDAKALAELNKIMAKAA